MYQISYNIIYILIYIYILCIKFYKSPAKNVLKGSHLFWPRWENSRRESCEAAALRGVSTRQSPLRREAFGNPWLWIWRLLAGHMEKMENMEKWKAKYQEIWWKFMKYLKVNNMKQLEEVHPSGNLTMDGLCDWGQRTKQATASATPCRLGPGRWQVKMSKGRTDW